MIKKVLAVSTSKGTEGKNPMPRIRIAGKWLVPLGFASNSFVSVSYRNEFIELQLEKSTIDFTRIRSKTGFLKISRSCNKTCHGLYPLITVRGYWLNDLGFTIGSVALVKCDVGKITIQLIKCDEL